MKVIVEALPPVGGVERKSNAALMMPSSSLGALFDWYD